MVPGCKNASQLCDGSVSFQRIPTDKTKQKIWQSKILRVNPRSLSYSYICSDHFSKDEKVYIHNNKKTTLSTA